jgi:outer membrane protein TolC
MNILPTLRRASCTAAFVTLACATPAMRAQLSLASAVDLALRNSPRVKSSEADVARARSVLAQSTDIYVPSVTAGAAIGQAYGYSNYPPTLFNVQAQSLIYNASQTSYVRSARAGLDAAQQSLEDTREVVAEDAALTFVALDHDQRREEVLAQESQYSSRLLAIVRDRVDAGLDSKVDLDNAELSVAQLDLSRLRAKNDTANDRNHLARLLGIPPGALRAEGGFPSNSIEAAQTASTGGYANASVAAAFDSAAAKQQQARGDAHFLYRPQVALAIQYNRYATFTSSFHNLEVQYEANGGKIGANEEVFGVAITIPIYDRLRSSKAVETAAEASKALHDAEFAQVNVLDAQSKLNNSLDLLKAQAKVATLEQRRAQDELEVVQLQLANPDSTPQPMTPKDEQRARINEREKSLAVIDAAFSLQQSEVSLLRQTGHLEDWLMHPGSSAAPQTPSTTVKKP